MSSKPKSTSQRRQEEFARKWAAETTLTTEEARERWLDVLRDPQSGKTKERLAESGHSTARCCLGHACAAVGLPLNHLYLNGELPDAVAKLLDIMSDGFFRKSISVDGVSVRALIDVNDHTDCTPAQIADIIEQQFAAGNILPYDPNDDGRDAHADG